MKPIQLIYIGGKTFKLVEDVEQCEATGCSECYFVHACIFPEMWR